MHSRCVGGLSEASHEEDEEEEEAQVAFRVETPPPHREEQEPQGPTSQPLPPPSPPPSSLEPLLHAPNERALATAIDFPQALGGNRAPDGEEQRMVSSFKSADVDACRVAGKRSAKRSVALATRTQEAELFFVVAAESGEGTEAREAPKRAAAVALPFLPDDEDKDGAAASCVVAPAPWGRPLATSAASPLPDEGDLPSLLLLLPPPLTSVGTGL